MQLGAFSISLALKDLAASRVFYEAFGFTASGGESAQDRMILRNGDSVIELFRGMFEKNMLTLNPRVGSALCRGSEVHRCPRVAEAPKDPGRRVDGGGR